MDVTSLFPTLESWLTPHFKCIYMDFPTKSILILFEKVQIFVKDRNTIKLFMGVPIAWSIATTTSAHRVSVSKCTFTNMAGVYPPPHTHTHTCCNAITGYPDGAGQVHG